MQTDRIKKILCLRSVTYLSIAIAIIGRIIQLVFFYNIRVDASFQVMAMQNFIYGHGISTGQVFPTDLANVVYEPLINWPPGYSLLLAPFYLVFNQNYIAAGLAVDIVSAVLLILMCRAILNILAVPLHLRNVFTLLTGFFIYSFYFIASSDAIAIAFFVTAIYLALSLLKHTSFTTPKTIGLSLCLLLSAFIKYLFIPAVFVVPLFLLVKGFADKNSRIKKAAIASFLGLFFAIAALLLYQKLISGSAAYISQPERGFFPAHLLDLYPFLTAALVNPGTVQLAGLPSLPVLRIFQLAHLLLLTIFSAYVVRELFRHRFQKLSLKKDFLLLSFFLALSIFLLLGALSLRVEKEEILPGWFWTYLEEPRYYGLAVVLVHLGLFLCYATAQGRMRRILLLFILLLSVEALRGVYLDSRRVILYGKEEYSWQYEHRFEKYADKVIRAEKQKYGSAKVVITGSSFYMNHRASLYDHVPIMYDSLSINQPVQLKASSPVLLVVILQKDHLGSYQGFLSTSQKELVGKWEGFYFYSLYVSPH